MAPKKAITLLVALACLFSITGCQPSAPPLSAGLDTSVDDTSFVEGDYTYDYDTVNDGIRILRHAYNYTDEEICVPEEINGKPVTALGNDVFYQHKNTVSIILPESLKRIEGSPFYRCYSLKSIIIPAAVESIERNPFFRSSALTEITVAEGNQYYTSQNGVLYNKEKTELIAYPEGKAHDVFVIPETITKLNIDSFGYHARFTKLTIPSCVNDLPEGNMFVFPDEVTLFVEKGSASEQYAKTYALKYGYISQT